MQILLTIFLAKFTYCIFIGCFLLLVKDRPLIVYTLESVWSGFLCTVMLCSLLSDYHGIVIKNKQIIKKTYASCL